MLQLSRQQARDLAREAKELADWTVVRDFASQIYGENKAAEMRIETHEEYDDENYSYPIGFIAAYDSEGKQLAPDRSSPFFQTEQWQQAEHSANSEEASLYWPDEDVSLADVLKKIRVTPTRRESLSWIFLDDLPANSKTYDLTTAPGLSCLPQEVTSCH